MSPAGPGLYNSRVIAPFLALARERYPLVDPEEVLARGGMAPHQVRDEGHWFSQDQVDRFYAGLAEATGNRRLAYEAGRYAVERQALGGLRGYLAGLIGPQKVFLGVDRWSTRLSRSATYRTDPRGPCGVEVTVTPGTGVAEQPFQCENRRGFIDGIAGLFALSGLRVEHPECLFAGGGRCRYLVSWQPSLAGRLLFARNYVYPAAALAVALPALLASPPLLATVVVPALGAGFLGLAWAAAAARGRELEAALDRVREEGDQALDRLQEGYDDALLAQELALVFARESDGASVAGAVLETLRQRLGFALGAVLEATAGSATLGVCRALGEGAEALFPAGGSAGPATPWVEAFATQRPIVCSAPGDPAQGCAEGTVGAAWGLGLTCLVACPVTHDGERLGVLVVGATARRAPLLQRDLHLLQGVATQLGAGLHYGRTREQLLHAQKLECVGRLAGGVAHDFNNVLSVILGYSELALGRLADAHPLRRHLGVIRDSSLRAAAFSRQLLALSRPQGGRPQAVDLNGELEQMAGLLTRLVGDLVAVEFLPGAGVPPAQADPGHLEQVVLNLAINARDAMPAGGHLRIRTEAGNLPGTAAPAAVLVVEDTGTGMPPEVRERIFEPFFTTKAPGQGTGLGLATVQDILRQLHGRLAVDSEPGRGTVFTLWFPAHPGEAAAPAPVSAVRGGAEVVLVAEDDPDLRRLVYDVLTPLGYRVHLATDGQDALEAAAAREEAPDLLLTDARMPRLGGVALARRLRERWPRLRVLVMSGYPEEVVEPPEATLELFPKPFTGEDLARRVRAALDAPA